MYWGLAQQHSEPFAAFLPRVVDLVTMVSGRGLGMWAQEECEIFYDQFHKGLWDFEAPYMDRYFTREWMTAKCTMEQLVQTAMRLDKNYPPSSRSHTGSGGLTMRRCKLAAVGSTGIADRPSTTVDRASSITWLKNRSPNQHMAATWSSLL